MFYKSTADVLRPVADSLNDRNLRLFNKNPEIPTPIFELAEHYYSSTDNKESVSNLYTEFMANHAPERSAQRAELVEARDQIVQNMTAGIKDMLNTTRKRIIPTAVELAKIYQETRDKNLLPAISVVEYHAHRVMDDLGLQEHVYSHYQDVPAVSEIESFILKPVSVDTIRGMIRANSHLSAEETDSWLSQVSDSVLTDIYHSLFRENRQVRVVDLDILRGSEIQGEYWYGKAFAGNNLLAAYLLTQYLRDNPQPLAHDNVGIEQWELVLGNLHTVLGAYLREYFLTRAKNNQRGRLILAHSSSDKVKQGDFTIILNGDLDSDRLKSIGTQVIIGSVMDGANYRDIAQFDNPELCKHFEDVWTTRWRILSQARKSDAVRYSVHQIEQLLAPSPKLQQDLFQHSYDTDMGQVWKERLHNELRGLKTSDLDDPHRLFVTLICKVYFPKGAYLSFLQTMDEWAERKKSDSRTAATQALIDTMVDWLAMQVGSEYYTPVPVDLPKAAPATETPLVEEEVVVAPEDDTVEAEVSEEGSSNPDAIVGAKPAVDDGNPLYK